MPKVSTEYMNALNVVRKARAAQRLADKTNPSLIASKAKRGERKAEPKRGVLYEDKRAIASYERAFHSQRHPRTTYIVMFESPLRVGALIADTFGPFETIEETLEWISTWVEHHGEAPPYAIRMVLSV